MIDSSHDSCIYCSKYLNGLNEFNKKMHIDTCKVRKLVESNNQFNNSNNGNQLEDYIILGDNCTYCFKSFKDFKSDFNKRLHIKCCKIKRENYEAKNQSKANNQNNSNNLNASISSSTSSNTTASLLAQVGETCLFCTKPLANLNEFNKRMHIENCKIRKSIEGNLSNRKSKKDDNLPKLGLDLGNQCIYCSKSFINLSDFNKKLHFEYCKSKKKKINELHNNNSSDGNNSLNASTSQSNNTSSQQNKNTNSSLSSQNNITTTTTNNNNNNNSLKLLDLGDSCLFCSRSLYNLSNFNKKVHIETCKIKQLKKANANANRLMKNNLNKAARKRQNKKEQHNQLQQHHQQQSQPQPTIQLIKDNGNLLSFSNMMTTIAMNNTSTNRLNPYDTIASTLNLNSLDPNQALITSLNQVQNTGQQQPQNLTLTSNHLLQSHVQLGDPNSNQIFI